MACESETRSDHDSEPDANDGYGTFVETIKERTNKTCVIKSITAAILVGFIIFVIVDSAKNEVLAGAIQAFLAWVEQNPAAGIFAFAGVYFLATVLFVPRLDPDPWSRLRLFQSIRSWPWGPSCDALCLCGRNVG